MLSKQIKLNTNQHNQTEAQESTITFTAEFWGLVCRVHVYWISLVFDAL